MDRLTKIRQRTEAAKAQKEKGDSITAACIAWSIVANDIPYLLSEVDRLQAALSESQRRERAAVEDLKRFSACCQCNANIDGSCCDMFDGTAENKYFCSNWQWRGPQEAEKGESHETNL